jgi:UDP-sulfoquinovose synthase
MSTKSHETTNIALACKLWNLKITDIMQGIVYGIKIKQMENDETLLTRFDIDQYFGTVINRFCAQAVLGLPVSVYGEGNQKRGFLSLKDSIQCLEIMIRHPAKPGEHQIINQFQEVYRLNEIANIIKSILPNTEIKNIENPRMEMEDHYYNPRSEILRNFGYEPISDIKTEINEIIETIKLYKGNIIKESIIPTVKWRK